MKRIKYSDRKTSLTKIQEEALIGSLLGDYYLSSENRKAGDRFKVDRAFIDYEYLLWEFELFKDLCSTSAVKVFTRKNNMTGKEHKQCSFRTLQHPILREFREKWYKDGIKIIPEDLVLTPMILARWFADDGHIEKLKNKLRINFYTNCFTDKEVDFLIKLLIDFTGQPFYRSKKTGVYKGERRSYWIIRGTSVAAIAVFNIINPLLKEMKMDRKCVDVSNFDTTHYRRHFEIFSLIKDRGQIMARDISSFFKKKNHPMTFLNKAVKNGFLIKESSDFHKSVKVYYLTELGLEWFEKYQCSRGYFCNKGTNKTT